MSFENTLLLTVFSLIGVIILVSIWWAFYTYKTRELENKIIERLQVIDIVLAVKKEFLIKLISAAKLKNKNLPPHLEKNPVYLWNSLQREVFIMNLTNFEEQINKEIKKLNKHKNKAVIEAFKKVEETEQRVKHNLFIYNNQVLTYNYKLNSTLGKFFLKPAKFKEKELINVSKENSKLPDLEI